MGAVTVRDMASASPAARTNLRHIPEPDSSSGNSKDRGRLSPTSNTCNDDIYCYIYIYSFVYQVYCFVYFPVLGVNCYSLYLLNCYLCDCLLVTVILLYCIYFIHYVKHFVTSVLKGINCYICLQIWK